MKASSGIVPLLHESDGATHIDTSRAIRSDRIESLFRFFQFGSFDLFYQYAVRFGVRSFIIPMVQWQFSAADRDIFCRRGNVVVLMSMVNILYLTENAQNSSKIARVQ